MALPSRKAPDDPPPGPLPPPKPMATYSHRRFILPDLNDKGEWLVRRLRDPKPDNKDGRYIRNYAHSQDRELFNFLRSVIDSPEFLFIRTDHAFALAQIMREPLAHNPVAKEWFVLCEPEYMDEAAYLYSVIYEWCKNSRVEEIALENFTDVPRDTIKLRIGKLFLREMIYSKLDR